MATPSLSDGHIKQKEAYILMSLYRRYKWILRAPDEKWPGGRTRFYAGGIYKLIAIPQFTENGQIPIPLIIQDWGLKLTNSQSTVNINPQRKA